MDKTDKTTERDGHNRAESTARLYQGMINEVQDYAILLLDTDGRVTEWNKGAEKIKGYKSGEIIGKNFSVFYAKEDVDKKLPNQLLQQAASEGSAHHDGWRIRKDGSRFWANTVITAIHGPDGGTVGFTKVTRDLTERKAAEDRLRTYAAELEQRHEALRQSEERYHSMISEVQDYAIILLNRDGDIMDWNTGAEYIKGYTASEVIGKNFRMFYTSEDRQQKLPETLIELAHRKGRAIHEGWRVRKDGTKFWGSVTITALHDKTNNVTAFSKVTRDLTERKLAEDHLRNKNRELEEMNMELNAMNKELSSFAYISSHDLQEPLRKIQTFSSRILDIDQDRLSQKALDYFKRIEAAAQRMRLLIDDLLTYSRANSAERRYETVDANKILEDITTDLEPNIEETEAIIRWQRLPMMEIIPFQIHQLFFNLIGNSMKFTRPGVAPEITISYELIPANLVPGNNKRMDETFHHITVADNGIGFDQEHAVRIFEVFQRLHKRDEYSGTGVGLAICKKIVENHEGIIRAEGALQKGATFHIYFPTSHANHSVL